MLLSLRQGKVAPAVYGCDADDLRMKQKRREQCSRRFCFFKYLRVVDRGLPQSPAATAPLPEGAEEGMRCRLRVVDAGDS